MANANKIIEAAMRNTPSDYLTSLFETRNPGPKALGSFFTKKQDANFLLTVEWEPYNHPDILSPAVGYKANIEGFVGLIELANWEGTIKLVPNAKRTGYMDIVIEVAREKADSTLSKSGFTTMLLGPGNNGELMVWSFFPGEPIMPSSIRPDDFEHPPTPKELARLGYTHAKIELVG